MSADDEATRSVADNDAASSQRVATWISTLLRWGVRASLVLVVVGTLISFAFDGVSSQTLNQLSGEAATFPLSVRWLARALESGEGRALIVLGLLLLIATPVLRVLLSLVVFVRQRERVYVLITAVVLMLLLLSFILGKAAS